MVLHSPSYRVVEAVAQAEGVSPAELSPPLYRVVDPEALDALVQSDAGADTDRVAVTFTYLDYVVRVESGPTVHLSVQDRNRSVTPPELTAEQQANVNE